MAAHEYTSITNRDLNELLQTITSHEENLGWELVQIFGERGAYIAIMRREKDRVPLVAGAVRPR